MPSIGAQLKGYRESSGLSLQQVQSLTGITNSRLSKMERNILECPITDLIKLAQIYHQSTVSIFVEAGLLSKEDLQDYSYGFQGISKLNEQEKDHIQQEINLLNRGRE